ncbi:MAG: glycoside hydrolase family 15 protein, partial [Chitinophagaceae bacterium]
MAMHKYNMGVVGNCSYMAYIDINADVRWMCMPRFDSSFLFGSLLDEKKGGHFKIRPANEGYTSKQYYINNTNILCTEFSGPEGSFRVVDCAPRMTIHERNFRPFMLVRKIELISGTPIVKTSCLPVDNYGESRPEVATGSNHISYLNLSSLVRLTTDIPINYVLQNQGFLLDQHRYMVLTYGEPLEAPLADTADRFIKKTTEYWQNWIKHCHLPNIYQEQVIRSALVLKLHQYEDTGGIIASGTTSLPEHDTGMRNWDYRYCWFRDAYYTLKAINQLGHFEELEKYFDFVNGCRAN